MAEIDVMTPQRPTVNDEAAWWRAHGLDAAGVGALFERHAQAVVDHCYRRSADWAAAQDVASMVFLELVRRPERLQFYDGSALPWLLATANNMERNRARSLRRMAVALRRIGQPRPAPDFSAESDGHVDDERRVAEAQKLVSRLTRRERDVFTLCDWAGLTYEQTAEALGIPVGTVRSRLSSARARLRRLQNLSEEDR